MKRILLILLFIVSYNCAYGNYDYANSSFNSVNCYRFGNTSYTQQQQPVRRIGYTTNYSNGQYNSGVYKHTTHYHNIYTPGFSSYNPGASAHHGSGPRKSAQRPFSGNWLEDFADWMRMNIDPNWPGYVDSDYWDEFLAEYPEYEDEAREWYENQGMHFPGDPDDPYPTPLNGEECLIMLVILYIIYKRRTGIFYAKI